MIDMDRFSHTFSFSFFAPLFELSDICVKLVDVFYEQLDSFSLRLLLTIRVDLSLESGDSAVSELRVSAGLAS
jgi:hypothetical protein